ncbi:DUF4097 family beta strand repeat-containing protein [Isoptericola hypogeus]|uniref:DUF4097 family beta strand repeat-containing protein n=1 Tax=Isoptericola hypogeus TaxID=300179 RepID=A0ABN2JDM3_9MICO
MHTFDTPTTVSLVLDVPAGRIQVVAADRPDTTVEVLPADASKGRDVKAAERTTVEYAAGVLRVTTPVEHKVLGSSGSVEVTVQLPAGSRVKVDAAGADVRGVGRLGEVAVDTAAGTITLDETSGGRAATLAGDVEVGRLTGPAELSTAKGDIRVAEAVRGTVTASTQAGSVSIVAAAGVSATLDASTALGRISNSLQNSGTPELEIHATTALGDITARSL